MREFNLDLAKSGAEIVTKDGKKVRIICDNKKGEFPIVALITHQATGKESVYQFSEKGYHQGVQESSGNLMML